MNSRLKRLFEEATGNAPVASVELAGEASARRYFRLTGPDGLTAIGTLGTDSAENRAFIYLSERLAEAGLPVPRVLAADDDDLAYIQTDLGDTSLFSILDTPAADEMLDMTMRELAAMHFKGNDAVDYARCHPVEAMDRRAVMWDLNYFKYDFVKISGIDFDEARLEDDFGRLADSILRRDGLEGFMLRDCQSRNVMVHDGRPWFIDFQSGRRGPGLYDVASFLWQARAGFSPALRQRLAKVYFDRARSLRPAVTADDGALMSRLREMALLRMLQVLGAYGFRGIVQQNVKFITSIPAAIGNLRELVDSLPEEELPELRRVTGLLGALPQYCRPRPAGGRLTVEVNSFGYRKSGIPRDFSGNGGGFVFDCRAIPNPGRFERFRQLTGLDTEVARFLEDDGGAEAFLNHAKGMVEESVRRYAARGFERLMVSFGCTGGRHRSVYCAERMARWISGTLGIDVELHHREQDIHRHIPAAQ